LAEIWAYIAEDSPERASAFVNQIAARFEPLLHHPELGPSREELAPGLRAHFHGNYVIYYTFTDTEVIIVHVVHGARDAIALFSGDAS
jgi:toxin ParE1/3/4